MFPRKIKNRSLFLPGAFGRAFSPIYGKLVFLCVYVCAFIIIEIRTGIQKKIGGNRSELLHVQRKVLVQGNKNCMVYKWVSIALVFPIEFRDFFAFTLIEILTGHKKKVRNLSECSQENSCERKKKIMVYKWVSIALVFPLEF